MNIPIYQYEINDGLAEQIQNNSVAYVSAANPDTVSGFSDSIDLEKILEKNISFGIVHLFVSK